MDAFGTRRKTDPQISNAITLGWRIATLYSLRAEELQSSPPDNLLPMRRSLPAAERLVLELRAAAGDACRLEIGLKASDLERMAALAARAPQTADDEARFRERIRAWHIELQTMLWAKHEPTGKAYELGSFLADTSNRVVRVLRLPGDACEHVTHELREVFSAKRVERVKRLLDDLQTRIDPAAVRVVQQNLESWQDVAAGRDAQCKKRDDLEPLDGQTVTWFQLVTGDKEPEAYLDHDDRRRLQGTLVGRTMRSYARDWRSCVVATLALAAMIALALFLPKLLSDVDASKLLAILGPVGGALGLSLASVGRVIRKSLDTRAELLWNTALVEVISVKTLRVDELLRAPQPRRARVAPRTVRRSVGVLQADRAT